ncbi:MAG: biotin--[acetyl-CoA-carboxylase] ligase [Opitutaceae bacterium]|nr:biotin--[acetyl-CoA-carboxylase] ligase [Opitutaceae bacterium]
MTANAHPAEVTILRELLAARNGYVSGAKLARLLGISRVAVWMHMGKLRRQGFAFEAVRSRGYRLHHIPAEPHPALILAHLHGRGRPARLLCLATVDSTNAEAERQLAAGCPLPCVIFAREQTLGRGRLGRRWHSAPNGSLYVSFAFRPHLEPAHMQDFTLWMGLNLCDLVANFCNLTPGIKWPNDLLIEGRKAGGMLTEARVDADQIRDIVFGLGLNVNVAPSDLPRDLQRTATSLAHATGRSFDLNRFAAALVGRILTSYHQFIDGSYTDKFARLWKRYDILRGQRVSLTQGQHTISGIAAGIDAEGSLILRLDNGRTDRFRSGEVSLAKNQPPGAEPE